jgi:hypothetical protein
MRRNWLNTCRIAISLALASIFGLAVYVILIGLPIATINWFPYRDRVDPPPVLAQDTYTYTIFLPLILNMCPYQSTRPRLQGTADFTGEIKILTPKDCLRGVPAETPIVTTGTYTGTPANVTLWVLAYAPSLRYYPQSPNACQGEPPYQEDGEWYVPAYLGEQGGPPEWFDIVVILADQQASQFLSNTVKEGCLSGQYLGVPAAQLNQMAITEKGYITVQTLD